MGIQFQAAQPAESFIADAPVVDVHSGHGVRLLDLLGLPVQPCGDVAAADLRDRAMVAMCLVDVDRAVADGPEAQRALAQIARGADPAHLRMRLIELIDVADWAHAHGRPISWG
jgi:hypothetical protein